MSKLLIAALPLCVALAAPASADPAVGLGVNLTFGGSGKVEAGLGLRLFTNDEEDEVVGAAGFDYMFQSQRIRPSLGAAYLGTNSYIGVDVGYDFGRGGLDFGVGIGGVNTSDPAPAAAAPVVTAPQY